MSPRQAKSIPAQARIKTLNHDGKGVARVDNKAVFIGDALPGETVLFHYTRRGRHYDEGVLEEVLQPSVSRVSPRCGHYATCGGCCLQHLSGEVQIEVKQAMLLQDLARIGSVTPEHVLLPLTADQWGYRRKARLGIRYVRKKGRLLVGFRERQGRYLADLGRCEVLHPSVGLRLQALATLIQGLNTFEHIPQVEVAVGDGRPALVLRHLQPLEDRDLAKLRHFERWYSLAVYLQPGGPATARPLSDGQGRLSYRLPEHDVDIAFSPTDFIQVNGAVNRKLVSLVVELMDAQPGESALDLFCGVGNFTLPMARRFQRVTAVEGDDGLVQRARDNAARHGLTHVDVHTCDLSGGLGGQSWWREGAHKVLLDPPRTGAREVVEALSPVKPRRIVYVSCNPATLARDARLLVHQQGYRLTQVAAVDMFPHTAHVEAVAVFDK